MTLKEMAEEYRANAALLQARTALLTQELAHCGDPLEQQLLAQRIRTLTQIYREGRAIARIMEHYYDVRRDRYVTKKARALFDPSEQ